MDFINNSLPMPTVQPQNTSSYSYSDILVLINSLKRTIDNDRWSETGRMMKIQRTFTNYCQKYGICRVQSIRSVLREAALWASSNNAIQRSSGSDRVSVDGAAFSENIPQIESDYDPIKLKWNRKLNMQIDRNVSEISMFLNVNTASEIMFQIIDDGMMEELGTDIKKRLSLCLQYAIWREREDCLKFSQTSSDLFLIEMDPLSVTLEYVLASSTENFLDLYKQFEFYLTNGIFQSANPLIIFSPWFAVFWAINNINLDRLQNSELKGRLQVLFSTTFSNPGSSLSKLNYYISTEKRANEDSIILSLLSKDLPQDPISYELLPNHDSGLLSLIYNIQNVLPWGTTVDRMHLLQSTVYSVIGNAIHSAKTNMDKIVKSSLGEDVLRNPSEYVGERGAEVLDHMTKSLIDKYLDDRNDVNIKVKRGIIDAEKLFIREGMSAAKDFAVDQLSMGTIHELENNIIKQGMGALTKTIHSQLSSLMNPIHVANDTIPLIISIFIQHEILNLSNNYTPSEIRDLVKYMIYSVYPLLLVSTSSATSAISKSQSMHSIASKFLQIFPTWRKKIENHRNKR